MRRVFLDKDERLRPAVIIKLKAIMFNQEIFVKKLLELIGEEKSFILSDNEKFKKLIEDYKQRIIHSFDNFLIIKMLPEQTLFSMKIYNSVLIEHEIPPRVYEVSEKSFALKINLITIKTDIIAMDAELKLKKKSTI